MISLILGSLTLMAVGLSAGDDATQVSVYGYVKLDALAETGRSSHGNFAIYALDPGENDGAFYLTANQTRLGIKISAGTWAGFSLSGRVEVDFYGGGAENKSLPFMRHAYLQLRKKGFTILAGQHWDIVNPLNPATLNYPVLWGSGNIGYRRPQLRFRQEWSAGKHSFLIEGGIFRTIAGDLDGDGVEDGVASGFPTLQGRVAAALRLGANTRLQLGVSGHYGRSSGAVAYASDSINLDLTLAVGDQLKVLGEYFSGRNLGAFLGGIAQGINPVRGVEIRSHGFYVNLQTGLSRSLHLSAGYGLDNPDDSTLAPGQRSRNATIFWVLDLRLSPNLKTGLEISHWKTDYQEGESCRTLRIQHSWILSF